MIFSTINHATEFNSCNIKDGMTVTPEVSIAHTHTRMYYSNTYILRYCGTVEYAEKFGTEK